MDSAAAPNAKKPKLSGTNGNNNSKLYAALINAQNQTGAVPPPRPHPARMSNGLTPMILAPNGMKVIEPQPNGNARHQPTIGRLTVPQNGNAGTQNTTNPPKQLKVKSTNNNTVTGVHLSAASQGNGHATMHGRAAMPVNGQGGVGYLQGIQAPFPSHERPQHAMVAAWSHLYALPDRPLPLVDRQIFSLMNDSWSLPWNKQMSDDVMYFLRNVPFFLIAKPGEPASACPLSRNLRKAWRLFGLYDSKHPTSDRFATGICCPACLQVGVCNTSSFIEFIDFCDEEQLLNAMTKMCQHLVSCRAAQSMAPELKKRSFTIERYFDMKTLKAFANWFCAFVHENESIDKGLHVLRPSPERLKLAENAVVRYMNIDGGADAALKDMQHTLECIPERMGKIPGVLLASDLTKLPLDDSASEFPFYSLLIKHIEIVRVTLQNPGHHGNLLKTLTKDSVVLFRCNCCHGQACEEAGSESTRTHGRSFVVYEATGAASDDLFCDLVKFVFDHVYTCSKMPPLDKQRLRRVMPRVGTEEFDNFVAPFFFNRIGEWDDYIKAELEYNKMLQSITPREDLVIWRTVDDLIEGGESIRSTYSSLAHRRVSPRLASDANDNDVIEGFDGATDYLGNRRFRELVDSVRHEFLAKTDLADKEAINMNVYDRITRRGGRFLRLDSDGIWTVLSRTEAAKRCRTALLNGFGYLLHRRPPRRRQGKAGCNVLETEIPPQFDLLSNRRRGSIVTKMTVDDEFEDEATFRKRPSPGSKCRAVADI